jgi:phosphomannomutase
MKQMMKDQKACFGGELSGHFYFAGNFNADSGAIALASALSVLGKSGKSMSQLIGPIARYAQSGEINFQIEDKDGAIADLKRSFGPTSSFGGAVDDLDGVTVDCFAKDGWWCNVRKSNTEPLLRLNLEARDPATLQRALELLVPKLGKRVDH